MHKPKSVNLSDVLPLLPQLNRRDLTLLRAAVDRLLGAPMATAGPLYEALLLAAGVKMPFSKFQRTKVYKVWVEAEPLFHNFITDTWGAQGRVTEHAIMVYLLELLAGDLRSRSLPVSVATLVLSLASVGRVLDYNFPGYRADGFSSLILRAMVHK